MPATTPQFPLAAGRLPLLGHVLSLARQRQQFLQTLRTDGDVVEIRIGRQPVYVINSPDLLRHVLVIQADALDRGPVIDKVRSFVGNGIAGTHGAFHLRQRHLIAPAFRRHRFPRYAELIRAVTTAKVESWRTGQRVAVDREMNDLALEVVTKTLISAHLSAADAEVIHRFLPTLMPDAFRRSLPTLIQGSIWRMLLAVEEKLPSPGNRRFAAARTNVRRVLDDVISAYRADGVDHGDILSVVVAANDPKSGEVMTETQVRDEAMSILLAGSESVGTVLGSLLYELGANPIIEARLRAELDDVLGDRPIAFDDIAKLTYTGRVIKETLRLHSPLWLLLRGTNSLIDLCGKLLPSGSMIAFSPHTLHRDPHLYPDPLRFDPDRWLSDRIKDLPREAFMPFAIGPHRCIGEFFALMELPIIVATIAAHGRLQPLPEYPVHEIADLLVHVDKLPMVAAPR